MKYILTLAAGFVAASTYGQCTISGDSSIKLNGTATFSVDQKADCNDCYSWKSSADQNIFFDGNSKSNQINVRASQVGKSVISVAFKNGQSNIQCEKTVDVVDSKPADSKCGVNISDFKEVKVNDKVISFFPNENSSDYLYNWTVKYANGEVKESAEKIPQFFFSEMNYITLVKLKIASKSPICTVGISKKYEQNFWTPTTKQLGKVEQKVYSPMSYSDYMKPEDTTKTNIKSTDKK